MRSIFTSSRLHKGDWNRPTLWGGHFIDLNWARFSIRLYMFKVRRIGELKINHGKKFIVQTCNIFFVRRIRRKVRTFQRKSEALQFSSPRKTSLAITWITPWGLLALPNSHKNWKTSSSVSQQSRPTTWKTSAWRLAGERARDLRHSPFNFHGMLEDSMIVTT